jgi:cell pole-organizing protein PopZ
MATRGGDNEPTMEDILASIRRIIADDQSDAPPSPGREARSDPESERRAARETRWRSLDEIEQGADEEEPYELTEETSPATPDAGARRWYDEPAEEPVAGTETGPGNDWYDEPTDTAAEDDVLELGVEDEIVEPDAEDEIVEQGVGDEVLELTELVDEDQSETVSPAGERQEEPLPRPEPQPGDAPPLPDDLPDETPLELTVDMEITDEAGIAAGGAETAAGEADAMPMAGMLREGQRGSQPSPAVAHAFSRLRQTMDSENGRDRRHEQRAEAAAAAAQPELQANLEQLLRPMIKEWLDENLPQAIDRLVREEVSPVAKDPEND